jgi:acyl-CoA reductase-like NAD-dependent aldehyde dehydrogenase
MTQPTDFYDKGAIYTSTYLEPVGVVGEIIPFNWPPIHAGGKMAPALAVGNTVSSSRASRHRWP